MTSGKVKDAGEQEVNGEFSLLNLLIGSLSVSGVLSSFANNV